MPNKLLWLLKPTSKKILFSNVPKTSTDLIDNFFISN